MLGNLLSKYIINQVTTEKVPSIYAKKCINSRQKRMRCNACVTACPESALSYGTEIKLNTEKCSNCNRCSSVCPSVAFVPRMEAIKPLYEAVHNQNRVSICCQKSSSRGTIMVGCLCELPWEFFAYAAMDKEVILDLSGCEQCTEENAVLMIKKNIERLKEFLGQDLFYESITLADKNGKVVEAQYTRREMLFYLLNQGKETAAVAAPFLFPKNEDPRIYRTLLTGRVRKMSDEKKRLYGWNSLVIGKSCYGCQVCEKLCPQQAIQILEEEGRRYFVHNYAKCTHCSICKTVCNQKAIELSYIRKDGSRFFTAYEIESSRCKICKDPIPPSHDEYCIICRRKQK